MSELEPKKFDLDKVSTAPVAPAREGSFFEQAKGFWVTIRNIGRPRITVEYPEVKAPTEERFHGRHQLNRHPDDAKNVIINFLRENSHLSAIDDKERYNIIKQHVIQSGVLNNNDDSKICKWIMDNLETPNFPKNVKQELRNAGNFEHPPSKNAEIARICLSFQFSR